MIKIIIPDYKLPSRNKTAKKHFRKYMAIRDEIAMHILDYMPTGIEIIDVPVNIRIDAYYQHNYRRDSDNVNAKLIIDVIKGLIIKDDDTRYVHDVTTRCHIGADGDKVVIKIDEIQQKQPTKKS
jgi:hypothetical protein